MAGIRRGQGCPVVLAATLLGAPLFVMLSCASAGAQSLYHQPVLTIDSGKHSAPIWSAAADAAGRFAVTGAEDKTVRVWDLSTRQPLLVLLGHAYPVSGVVFSPDGRRLASASGDQVVKVGDKDIKGITADQATSLIQGPSGSKVSLTISRGGNTMTFTITRADDGSVTRSCTPGTGGAAAGGCLSGGSW